MKLLLILFVVSISSAVCSFATAEEDNGPGHQIASKTPHLIADQCAGAAYEHKSKAEISSLTPIELIEEMVNEQLSHASDLDDETADLIHDSIRREGIKILPVLTESIGKFDSKRQDCIEREVTRVFVASAYASDIDRSVVRLRGIEHGKQTISALERVVGEMRFAGFDDLDHPFNSQFGILQHHLEMAKGTNIKDEIIRRTIEVKHKAQMTESEFSGFVTFLTQIDPTYPSWSMELDETPSVLVESEKYHYAYLNFKKQPK